MRFVYSLLQDFVFGVAERIYEKERKKKMRVEDLCERKMLSASFDLAMCKRGSYVETKPVHNSHIQVSTYAWGFVLHFSCVYSNAR